jgi:hypothetical protein
MGQASRRAAFALGSTLPRRLAQAVQAMLRRQGAILNSGQAGSAGAADPGRSVKSRSARDRAGAERDPGRPATEVAQHRAL